jgi:hypothetical protein
MRAFRTSAAFVVVLVVLPGCAPGLQTYPVQGKVVLAGGDVKQLTDAHVEFQLESDPTVRADGLIASDGSFEIQMLHRGRVLRGMPAGKYRARLLFDDEARQANKNRLPVGRQFLDFKASGLWVTVPAEGELTLTVAKR